MDTAKIVRLVAAAFAVVAGVVTIPQSALIIAVLGLVVGWFVEEENVVSYLVVALALGASAGALSAIPGAGPYLTSILTSVSSLLYAGACTVIAVRVYNRVKP